MSKKENWKNTSPLDVDLHPNHLMAHVVEAGESTRIFGYDVVSDLACHYSFAEMILLLLTGELADRSKGRAFEMTLGFLSPASVAEAPTHATVLARIAGADSAGLVGVASVALAEQARDWLSRYESFLRWLENIDGDPPEMSIETDGGKRRLTAEMKKMLAQSGVSHTGLDYELNKDALILTALYDCGLTAPHQIEGAVVMARLPCLMAEAHACTPGKLDTYPMNLPPFKYEE